MKGKLDLNHTKVSFQKVTVFANGERKVDLVEPVNDVIFGDEDSKEASLFSDSRSDECFSVLAQDGDYEDGLFSSSSNEKNNQESARPVRSIFEICLVKGLKFVKLTTYDEIVFFKWKYHLSKICLTEKLNDELMLTTFGNPKLFECLNESKNEEIKKMIEIQYLAKDFNELYNQDTSDLILELYPTLKFDFSVLHPEKITRITKEAVLTYSCALQTLYKTFKSSQAPEIVQIVENRPFEVTVVFQPNTSKAYFEHFIQEISQNQPEKN